MEILRHFDPQAKDIIKKLLQSDRTKRLGNLKGGGGDVMKHKYFKGIDWDGLLRRNIPPPIVPEVRHPADTRNFDSYPDSPIDDATGSAPILDARAKECFELF